MDDLKEDLFYLIGYLVTSARGLYDEPPEYGIFRLIDATTRLLKIMDDCGLADEFLIHFNHMLEEEIAGSMDDTRQKETLDRSAALFQVQFQQWRPEKHPHDWSLDRRC